MKRNAPETAGFSGALCFQQLQEEPQALSWLKLELSLNPDPRGVVTNSTAIGFTFSKRVFSTR